jgi:hypothetical protein
MDKKQSRRWLQFQLQTFLLAVTVACVWLGWQCRIVHERREVRRLIGEVEGFVEPLNFCGLAADLYEQGPEPSFMRRLLGDESLRGQMIVCPRATDASLEARMRAAFPEAQFLRSDISEEERRIRRARAELVAEVP